MYYRLIMTKKNALVQTRVSKLTHSKFGAVAAAEGLTVSDLLRLMIDQVTEDVVMAEGQSSEAKPKREAKVTVRLPDDVAEFLTEDAKAQGVTPSTWAATILMAKFRSAPQLVKPQRNAVQKAFRQLRGIAININQIAAVMNRGVFTGDNYAPSKIELLALRSEVSDLRSQLAKFAGGQFEIQKVEVGEDG